MEQNQGLTENNYMTGAEVRLIQKVFDADELVALIAQESYRQITQEPLEDIELDSLHVSYMELVQVSFQGNQNAGLVAYVLHRMVENRTDIKLSELNLE
jgi:hypothetical protein